MPIMFWKYCGEINYKTNQSIPKNKGAIKLRHFRPISLTSSVSRETGKGY